MRRWPTVHSPATRRHGRGREQGRPARLVTCWPPRHRTRGWRLAARLLLPLLLVLAVPAAGIAQQPGAPLGRLRAVLSSQEVLPDPGPAGAEARLVVDLHADQVCWELAWSGVEPIAAHIQRGAAGEIGPVAVGLYEVQTPLAGEDARQGCTGADPALLRDLSQQPDAYYAQVRSQQHPDGAARGQLRREGQLPNTGPGLALPSPLTQIMLFMLVGGAFLLAPLADRYRRRVRRG